MLEWMAFKIVPESVECTLYMTGNIKYSFQHVLTYYIRVFRTNLITRQSPNHSKSDQNIINNTYKYVYILLK